MNINDKPLKGVELTNVDEQMQDVVNAVNNEDTTNYLSKEESLLVVQAETAIKEIRKSEVSIKVFNTRLDDNALEDKSDLQSALEHAFKMDDLLSLFDDLWPIIK